MECNFALTETVPYDLHGGCVYARVEPCPNQSFQPRCLLTDANARTSRLRRLQNITYAEAKDNPILTLR